MTCTDHSIQKSEEEFLDAHFGLLQLASLSLSVKSPDGDSYVSLMGEEEKIESELKGNTLRVYWMLLQSRNASAGVREVQRQLGFSSPALASYHLNKLAELGLVGEKNGEYHLVREVRVGVLKQFTKFGSIMLPRHVLYAAMFTTLFVYFLTQLRDVNFYSVFAFIFGLLGNVVLWYETVRVWRQRP